MKAAATNLLKPLIISDVTAMSNNGNGPIELFTRDCPIENPYFLYDPLSNTRYDTFHDAASKGAS
jgi:hypothetical protein